ncbi:MAG: protealysin inhibitor emfourin [Burkholderiaceae bacterium]
MTRVQVERLGGLAGFGTSRSHLRSRGEVDPARLSEADCRALEALFEPAAPAAAAARPDAFRYRLTRQHGGREQCVEVAEDLVPHAVRACVRDELV